MAVSPSSKMLISRPSAILSKLKSNFYFQKPKLLIYACIVSKTQKNSKKRFLIPIFLSKYLFFLAYHSIYYKRCQLN